MSAEVGCTYERLAPLNQTRRAWEDLLRSSRTCWFFESAIDAFGEWVVLSGIRRYGSELNVGVLFVQGLVLRPVVAVDSDNSCSTGSRTEDTVERGKIVGYCFGGVLKIHRCRENASSNVMVNRRLLREVLNGPATSEYTICPTVVASSIFPSNGRL